MTYGRYPYGGVAYAGGDVAQIPTTDTRTTLAVEVAFTTNPLAEPAWVDITPDVRSWDVSRGRSRELERFQPGRATVVLGNLSRQYDSVNAAGPWFGNLKPMKRIRIRETFNGVTYPVFDGFVDRWQLDYPGVGKDAVAVVTATDAFKVFARTDLGRSVYQREVLADAPQFWWRLNDQLSEFTQNVALNDGSVGAAGNGTYVGSVDGQARAMIVNDPDNGIEIQSSIVEPTVLVSGVDVPSAQINLLSRIQNRQAFTLSAWVRPVAPDNSSNFFYVWYQRATSPGVSTASLRWSRVSGGDVGSMEFNIFDGAINVAVSTGSNTMRTGDIHHVVVTAEPSGADLLLRMYLDGVQTATTTFTGTVSTATITFSAIGHPDTATNNWNGRLQGVALWTSTLTAARIAAHYTAGTTPWVSDFPSGRLRRLLSIQGWPGGPLYLPSDWVQIDDGNVAFQPADINNQTLLEHAQKTGETEFGLLFIDRAGRVRFIDRANQFARAPRPEIFGDSGAEIGYTAFVPDDGDEVIRNRATISRLNGVAQVAEDATSITAVGRFDYVLDGLLHSSDTHSASYASFIVAEYKNPRRRITSLSLGPPIAGLESTVYPAMLGPEIGDAITVRSRPVGGGALFEQVCVIEGIQASGAPGGISQRTFILSPEIAGSF